MMVPGMNSFLRGMGIGLKSSAESGFEFRSSCYADCYGLSRTIVEVTQGLKEE